MSSKITSDKLSKTRYIDDAIYGVRQEFDYTRRLLKKQKLMESQQMYGGYNSVHTYI